MPYTPHPWDDWRPKGPKRTWRTELREFLITMVVLFPALFVIWLIIVSVTG